MIDKNISISIDGPSGSGKSTIAKIVASKLNFEYIDTGSMYRALTLKTLKLDLNPMLKSNVLIAMENTTIDFNNNHIYLDSKNVDAEIRKNIINKYVSYIAKIEEVRNYMVDIQRKLAREKSVVMDGRDVGSVVLPEANYKFFIIASIDERSNRRYKELKLKGETNITFEQVKKEMIKRDHIDTNRKVSPLVKPENAYVIDNTYKTIEESVNEIISIVKGV